MQKISNLTATGIMYKEVLFASGSYGRYSNLQLLEIIYFGTVADIGNVSNEYETDVAIALCS